MLKNVIYLKEEDYIKLKRDGTAEINGQTITYSENDIYMTPDDTDSKLAAIESKIYELGLNTGTKLYKHTISGSFGTSDISQNVEAIFYSTRNNTNSFTLFNIFDETIYLSINPEGIIATPYGKVFMLGTEGFGQLDFGYSPGYDDPNEGVYSTSLYVTGTITENTLSEVVEEA